MKKLPKAIAIILGILILAVGSLYGYLHFVVFDNPFNNKKFNQQTWKQFDNNDDPDNPRGEMYEDLQKHYLKKGMGKNEVITLLGAPDIKHEKNLFSYNIGMWSGFRIDYDSLDIEFNDKNNLTSITRVQH